VLELRQVILLDSQSTMDLMCNHKLVDKVYKSTSTMRLKSNIGEILVDLKAKVPGYKKSVWFSTKAITKIVVHQELENKPNMEFRLHENGLHYYDPRKQSNLDMLFFETV